MTISLTPEHQKLIEKKVQTGEFPSAEAVVEFALNRFLGTMGRRDPALSVEERVKALDEFLREVDHDPTSTNEPLPADALRRRNLYDNHRMVCLIETAENMISTTTNEIGIQLGIIRLGSNASRNDT